MFSIRPAEKKSHDPPWETLLWREKQPRASTEAQPELRAAAAWREGCEQRGHSRSEEPGAAQNPTLKKLEKASVPALHRPPPLLRAEDVDFSSLGAKESAPPLWRRAGMGAGGQYLLFFCATSHDCLCCLTQGFWPLQLGRAVSCCSFYQESSSVSG